MTDHAPLLERAFDFIPREDSYLVEDIQGSLPDFIRGSYYVNGPARFSRGETRYRHWLDGDGMVCSLRFGANGIRFTNRFVRSIKWKDEEEAGRALYRTFGTAFEGDLLNNRGVGLESPANVSIYEHGGRLLAFGEQGLPYLLDLETLETTEQYTFEDRLNEVSPFSAHPKIDPQSGELFNFGVSFSSLRPSLIVYRFDAQSRLVLRKRHPLDEPTSMHDFGLSPNHTCFYVSPFRLEMSQLQEGKSLMESLHWDPSRPSRLLIAARESGGQRAAIRIGQGHCLHFINLWEEDGLLQVDIVELDEPIYQRYEVVPDLFEEVGSGRPVRLSIDTTDWTLKDRRELPYDKAPDFPALDPRLHCRRYDDFWMLGISATGRPGRKFFDQLVHCRWSEPGLDDIYTADEHCYLGGEPVFLPDAESDRGAVICQEFNAEKRSSAFLIFDPLRVADGPVARLQLRHPIPPFFHASFSPAGSPGWDESVRPGDDWFRK